MLAHPTVRHDPAGQTTGNAIRGPQHLADRLLRFDFAAEVEQLKREPVGRRNARSGKTLVKAGSLRVTLTALKPGATMADEHVDGRMTAQVS